MWSRAVPSFVREDLANSRFDFGADLVGDSL